MRQSDSVAGVLRHLGLRQAGGTHAHLSRVIRTLEVDTSHFVRHQGGGQHRRLDAAALFEVLPPGTQRRKPHLLLRALLEIGRDHVCSLCGNDGTWQGQRLVLQVDHVDGDFHNNLAENLRFLCPNCHSQTPNFSCRGKGRFTTNTRAAAGTPPGPAAADP